MNVGSQLYVFFLNGKKVKLIPQHCTANRSWVRPFGRCPACFETECDFNKALELLCEWALSPTTSVLGLAEYIAFGGKKKKLLKFIPQKGQTMGESKGSFRFVNLISKNLAIRPSLTGVLRFDH